MSQPSLSQPRKVLIRTNFPAEERPWLAAELEAAGLAGRSLVHEVVLPALGVGPSTRELQAELEAALGGPRAEAAPLF